MTEGIQQARVGARVLENATTGVVVLVHGIRDYALWQNSIRATLERAGFKVEPTNYDRFNLIKFLLPIWFFRRQAIEDVRKQIKTVADTYPDMPISVIAHSFGTFVVSHLLKDNSDLKFDRIIFCGSVVPYNFVYEDFRTRFAQPILNEVGTRDVWPAIAESATSGYGSAGTYGFRRPLVRDRWHNGAGHGYFLKASFCQTYWVPFLRDGEIVPAADEPEPPKSWLKLLSTFKIKYLLIALLALLAAVAIYLRPNNVLNNWMATDSDRVLMSRAFAMQVSLMRAAIRPARNEPDRQMLAIRSGATIERLTPVYACAFQSDPDGRPSRQSCGSWEGAMSEYSAALYNFAKATLPPDAQSRLAQTTKDNIRDLMNALFRTGAMAGSGDVSVIYGDAVDFEARMWLATPAIDDRAAPQRVDQDRVAGLKKAYEEPGNDPVGRRIAAINALRKNKELRPLVDRKLLFDLAGQLSDLCGQVTADPASLERCRRGLPVPIPPGAR